MRSCEQLPVIFRFLSLNGCLKDFLFGFFFRGEKYMGMWESDSRHGPGLLVTLDGIYNQGNFLQNKLMVCTYFT